MRAEAFRKQPWRLALAFGPRALIAFWRRRFDLDTALEQISRVIGARVQAVRMPFAEAAIDVDRAADLALATQILAEREARLAWLRIGRSRRAGARLATSSCRRRKAAGCGVPAANPQPDLEAPRAAGRRLDLVEVVLGALLGAEADVGGRARTHHRDRSRGALQRSDQRPVAVSVQDQIDPLAAQHGAQRVRVA